jgi:hypothetical protein
MPRTATWSQAKGYRGWMSGCWVRSPCPAVLLGRAGERVLLAVLAIHAGQVADTATLLRLPGDGGGVDQITTRTLTDYITAVRGAIQQAGGSRGMLPGAPAAAAPTA